jgi:hypothetical protein
MILERGMLITSIDVDVGNRNVGLINRGRNDINVHDHLREYEVGAIEEIALPLFTDLFDQFRIPVTFGVRGQSLEVQESTIAPIIQASVKHDIGLHGYSHKSFRSLSRDEAERELKKMSVLTERLHIIPKSFIFPRNMVAHLDLLEKYGYRCYRGRGDFIHDGMYIKNEGRLCDIHPSLFIGNCTNVVLTKKMIDIAVERKLPFHVWFHLWDLGSDKKSILHGIRSVFLPFFEYAGLLQEGGLLSIETMVSAVKKIDGNGKS